MSFLDLVEKNKWRVFIELGEDDFIDAFDNYEDELRKIAIECESKYPVQSGFKAKDFDKWTEEKEYWFIDKSKLARRKFVKKIVDLAKNR